MQSCRRQNRGLSQASFEPPISIIMKLIFAAFASALCSGSSSAFVVNQHGGAVSHRTMASSHSPSISSSALNMGGFGGGGGMGKKGGKKGDKKDSGAPLKLKAKSQWDR